MPDNVNPAQRSRIMSLVTSRDTKPELEVRHAVHAAGHRYRIHRRDLPGSPDLVFPKYRLAVFVNGCQWHWHGCKRSRMPSSNVDYWTRKIKRNVERDARNRLLLEDLGWRSRVIWECEMSEGTADLMRELADLRGK